MPTFTIRTRSNLIQNTPPSYAPSEIRMAGQIMKSKLASGFWSGGQDELLKSLNEEEAKALAPLLAALKKNKTEISKIKKIFKEKRRQIRSCLFAH